MNIFILKMIIAAALISFCSWLAGRKPDLAGFIIALPLTSMIAMMFSYAEFRDSDKSVEFAKSIFVGVPLSLLFFVPFLLAKKWNLNFLACYGAGFILLAVGFTVHRAILK